jgi:hypothetical protein
VDGVNLGLLISSSLRLSNGKLCLMQASRRVRPAHASAAARTNVTVHDLVDDIMVASAR